MGPSGGRGRRHFARASSWQGDAFEQLRSELSVLTDDKGREFFDLPAAPRPGGETPLPPRFLPEYDNTLLAHADRSRIVADAFRAKVFLPGLRVAATFLVDGFVRGIWKVERVKKPATLAVTPFTPLLKKERDSLAAEAEFLTRFVEPDAATFAVRFGK